MRYSSLPFSVGNQFANRGVFKLSRDIRALGPENGGSVPVIAMTAFAQISDPEAQTPRAFRSIGASRLLRTSC